MQTNPSDLSLANVPTPSLVLDEHVLDRNLRRMAAAVNARGARLRPHIKTSKCVEVAKKARELGASGLTVSTLREAEYFHAHGFSDLFYAVAIGPGKHERAARLARDGAALRVCVDTLDGAKALAASARRLDLRFQTLIEIDCGDRRCGVSPGSPELLSIAEILAPDVTLLGVFTHAGQSYQSRGSEAFSRVAEAELSAVLVASERLRAKGHACPVLSLGSSPTAGAGAGRLDGVEIRCGVYMFGDLFQAGIGSCSHEDIALSVLTEVISLRSERNELLIDAGALALSKDRSTEQLGPGRDCAYGVAVALDGTPLAPALRVGKVSQEHGTLVSDSPIDFNRFPVGTRLRILPNHSCLTAAAHERYWVVGGQGSRIRGEWTRVNGW